nr:thiol:disulfide interchange protein DsbA/DsbL [uncultured Campylobacter sp.]
MKIISKFMRILAVFCLLGSMANALEEGKEYQILQKPLDVPKNSVVKVFSYECPHCYKFDKTVTPKLFSELDGVKFIPYHLKTKGKLGETASKIFAAMIVLDEASDVSLLSDKSKFKKAKFAIYKATHDKDDDFNGGKDKARFIQTALSAAGVSDADYDKALASERAQEILKAWDDSYDVAKIQGVPAYVVGGKYLINVKAIGSVDAMAAAVKELLAK